MTSDWYQGLFATRMASRQAVSDFMTTEQGVRMATSVGGMLTGRGADLIIIDDPLKPDEALSETRRKAVNEWYDNTLLSRLNDKTKGCIVLIMQRLHQDDLVGHVLEQEPWEVLSFPAIADENKTYTINSPLGQRLFERKVGEALHPEREPLEILARMRATIGEYNFLSQYQQNPSPPGGAMVKTQWLRFYEPSELPESFSRIVQSWDTANKAGELNDFSVCTTWGVLHKEFFLLDVVRRRLNYPDLKRLIVEHAHRFNAKTILIEDKASGTQLIQDLKADCLFGTTAYEPPTGTDKVMRLHAQTAIFESGLVRLPRAASWLNDYVHELTSFPGCKYDDQVDSTTQVLDHLRVDNILEVWRKFGENVGAFNNYFAHRSF
jgi:predicted phage terminase large subunit-like protein